MQKKQLHPVRVKEYNEENKSTAKAAGLKSTFITGEDELLMTSFGKGNAAKIEKKITAGTITDLTEEPALTVKTHSETRFHIDGRVKNASTDNPLYHTEGQPKAHDDLIHARAALEKMYYKENFQDNIHIQAIYSIMDIEKILTTHLNNIVYTLNNFLRNEGEDVDDFVGYLDYNTPYEQFINPGKSKNDKKNTTDKELLEIFDKLCAARQLRYLNLEIIPRKPRTDKNGKIIKQKIDHNTLKIAEKEFYYMLAAISRMRQMLAHGNPKQNIYLTEGFGKDNAISKTLDYLYSGRVRELNNNFVDKAGKNLAILFSAFSVRDKEQKASFVQHYYNFTVRKDHKNTGFSIKLLREHMTAEIEEASVLRSTDYDSVRGKLYPFTDFAIYRYYQQHDDEAKDLVASLRASFNDKEKDAVYSREAARIWPKPEIGDIILHHILPEMIGDHIKEVQPDPDVSTDMLKDILVTTEATTFTKMIYMITLFINGKEINDLLTSLIHQLDNIASFITVMKSQGMRTGFMKDFQLFNQSKKVVDELRIVNNMARMTKEAAKAKEIMYIEAFRILGMKETNEEKLTNEIKDMLDPEKSGKGSHGRGLRNFIANNVIESVRFKYLVRYGNVKKLKKLAENAVLVAFVLKDIPDDQIRRYYIDTGETEAQDVNAMRSSLTQRLTGFTFEDLRDVRQSGIENNKLEQDKKQQKQALVRLYLTVLYLIIKNLVYINSRYFLAFHCVERDRLILNPDYWQEETVKNNKGNKDYEYAVFARWFFEQYPIKSKKVSDYMQKNFANSDDWAIRAYRNKIEHLDAVRNADMYINDIKEIHTWYELYHYIMQRRIKDQFNYESQPSRKHRITAEDLNPKTWEYFRKVENYGSYCKDFVKALNMPFAYNLPRYKNLSIDELFDRNHPLKKEKKAGKELENDE